MPYWGTDNVEPGFRGPAPGTAPPALCHGNISRGVIPTPGRRGARRRPILVLAGAALLGGGPLPHAGAVGQAIAADRMLADPADVVSAYGRVRDWIRAFAVPHPDDPAARTTIAGADGVCVVLRRGGRVVGIGTDTGGDELMARRAAGRALSRVLGDQAVANLPVDLRPDFGAGLTVEVEVAGRFVPILGRTFAQIAERLEPGLDGVAMRRGDTWAVIFPAQARATNTAGRLEAQLPGLAIDLGLTPKGLPDLTRQHGVALYSFRTTHLAQPGPGRPPFETFRGGAVVPEAAVVAQGIIDLADGIARHLLTTVWPDERPGGGGGEYRKPMGVMGDYRAVADQYRPPVAPPIEQALVSLALTRYSQTPSVDVATARAARTAALGILRDLSAAAGPPDDWQADVMTCGVIVHALLEGDDALADPALAELLATVEGRVVGAYREGRGFVQDNRFGAPAETIPPYGQALLASALSRRLRATPGSLDPDLVGRALDRAWQSVPPRQAVNLVPWIGWAEVDFAAATGRPIRNVERLLGLRRAFGESQIGPTTVGAAPDLRGGFRLGAASPGRATAQSTRPAAFLAWMIREPRLTPPRERMLALGRHLRTVRFLMQLAVTEEDAWSFRNPARALGGLRAAPWDSDQPVAAQALGLIGAAETILSLGISQTAGNP